jgi:hypothetical protein
LILSIYLIMMIKFVIIWSTFSLCCWFKLWSFKGYFYFLIFYGWSPQIHCW